MEGLDQILQMCLVPFLDFSSWTNPSRWRWSPTNLTKQEIVERALTIEDAFCL